MTRSSIKLPKQSLCHRSSLFEGEGEGREGGHQSLRLNSENPSIWEVAFMSQDLARFQFGNDENLQVNEHESVNLFLSFPTLCFNLGICFNKTFHTCIQLLKNLVSFLVSTRERISANGFIVCTVNKIIWGPLHFSLSLCCKLNSKKWKIQSKLSRQGDTF